MTGSGQLGALKEDGRWSNSSQAVRVCVWEGRSSGMVMVILDAAKRC